MTDNTEARSGTAVDACVGVETPSIDANEFATRYVALWNEPEPNVRAQLIRELWLPASGQVLMSPPEEMTTATKALGFDTTTLEVHGYEALDTRVTRAYEAFVAPGTHRFRSRHNASRLGQRVITFNWEMVSTTDDTVAGVGLEVFFLGDDGRISTDYQFIEG